MKKSILFALFMVLSYHLFAQQTQQVEMADKLRDSGKIYVVIATIIIVFLGLALFLFRIDSRLKKIEKDQQG